MSETSTIKSRSFYQALALLSIYARLRASLAKLDEGEFTEGHELDRKYKVAKEMVGRRLSQEEAKRSLAKFA